MQHDLFITQNRCQFLLHHSNYQKDDGITIPGTDLQIDPPIDDPRN